MGLEKISYKKVVSSEKGIKEGRKPKEESNRRLLKGKLKELEELKKEARALSKISHPSAETEKKMAGVEKRIYQLEGEIRKFQGKEGEKPKGEERKKGKGKSRSGERKRAEMRTEEKKASSKVEKRRRNKEESREAGLEKLLDQARAELAEYKERAKKPKSEKEKKELENLEEDYRKARRAVLESKLKELRKNNAEQRIVKREILNAILSEQGRLVEEREKYRSPKLKFLDRLLNNKVMKAYMKVPRKYRWVGMAGLGSVLLLGSGAGVAAAGTYFGLKLSKYAVGALTSAGAMKVTEAFEKFYGTKLGKKLDRKVFENIDRVREAEGVIDNLISDADEHLEKVWKLRKRANMAKVLAGITGFLAGYEATDVLGGGILETLGLKAEIAQHITEAKAQAVEAAKTKMEAAGHTAGAEVAQHAVEAKVSYIEVAQKGDSVWKMAKKALSQKLGAQWNQLDEAQRTYLIDAIKDKVSSAPEKFGLHTNNVDLIHPGDKVDFSSLLNNKEFVQGVVDKTQHLSFADKAHIVSHIDWRGEVPMEGGTKAMVSNIESVHGNLGVGFVDVNHDGVPDGALLVSKGQIIERIPFRGDPHSLKDIADFSNFARHQVEILPHQYPPEVLDNPAILKEVIHNPNLLSNLEGLAKASHSNMENAFAGYHQLGGHLELLKDAKGNWDPDQMKILSIVKGGPAKVQDALSFSKKLTGMALEKKIAWTELHLDATKYKEAVRVINPDIDPSKIINIQWRGDNLVLRVSRKLWFDKTVKLSPFSGSVRGVVEHPAVTFPESEIR